MSPRNFFVNLAKAGLLTSLVSKMIIWQRSQTRWIDNIKTRRLQRMRIATDKIEWKTLRKTNIRLRMEYLKTMMIG